MNSEDIKYSEDELNSIYESLGHDDLSNYLNDDDYLFYAHPRDIQYCLDNPMAHWDPE